MWRPPERARAVVEVPRGSFVKRELHEGRRIDYVSPVPCPFNYGHVPDTLGPDGDPLDAVVLGPRLALASEVELPVVAIVRFYDAGKSDDKLVLSDHALDPREIRDLRRFFRVYALARSLINFRRQLSGETSFTGVVPVEQLQPFRNRR